MNKVDVVTALVIVESPAKAKTISEYLGDGYTVMSSVGHIRDLVTKKDLPDSEKNKPWAELGVDIKNNFEPHWIISKSSEKTVKELKRALKKSSKLYLATDEDREGEAIAWHLYEVLKPEIPVERMVFNEITQEAIDEAISNCRQIEMPLVYASVARRILDRIFGFELTGQTRQAIGGQASAGRVQSPTTRLLVERERERRAFKDAGFYSLSFDLIFSDRKIFLEKPFQLKSVNGEKIATGKDFGDDGKLKKSDLLILDKGKAESIQEGAMSAELVVSGVDKQPYNRKPYAPFTTSSFQQAASSQLGLKPKAAMAIASSLYRRGYLTYIRTDSTNLSDIATFSARNSVENVFPNKRLLSDSPRKYANKVKNAQEAHEAIRPAAIKEKAGKKVFLHPEEVAQIREVVRIHAKAVDVYRLVWERTLASQMRNVEGETTRVHVEGVLTSGNFEGKEITVSSSETIITNKGFRELYVNADDYQTFDEKPIFDGLGVGNRLEVHDIFSLEHFTKPPSRYSEAALVKKMEEIGIGRPSTYAATIDRVKQNDYAWTKGQTLFPTVKGFAKTQLLETDFPNLVDNAFTARMEDQLDVISNSDDSEAAEAMFSFLNNFYWGYGNDENHGNGQDSYIGLHNRVEQFKKIWKEDPQQVKECSSFSVGKTLDGEEITVRYFKTPYLRCGAKTKNVDPHKPVDEITEEFAIELLEQEDEKPMGYAVRTSHGLEEAPEGTEGALPIFKKLGPYSYYVQAGEWPTLPEPSTREDHLYKLRTRKSFKVASAYLRNLFYPADGEALKIASSNPKRGIGESSLEKLVSWSEENDSSLLEAFQSSLEIGIKGAALNGIEEFLDLRRLFEDSLSDVITPSEFIKMMLQKSGYWAVVEMEIEKAQQNLEDLEDGDNMSFVSALVSAQERLQVAENHLEILKSFLEIADTFDTCEELAAELNSQKNLGRKPVTSSILWPQDVKDREDKKNYFESISFDEVLNLLSYPKVIGPYPENPAASEDKKDLKLSKNFGTHYAITGKKGSYVVEVIDRELIGVGIQDDDSDEDPLGGVAVKPKGSDPDLTPGSSMVGIDWDLSESLDFEDDPEELSEKRLLAILERKEERKGHDFIAAIGPFGPYIRLGKEARSVPERDDFLDLTVSDCIKKFKEKKTWNKRAPKAQWSDEKWGNIQLLTGKFGDYVHSTELKINTSLTASDIPEELTKERAIELLEEAELKKLESD